MDKENVNSGRNAYIAMYLYFVKDWSAKCKNNLCIRNLYFMGQFVIQELIFHMAQWHL